MAKTKDFSQISTGRVYEKIAEATAGADPQEKPKRARKQTYTEEEAQELLMTMKTVGHKGVKLPRINVAFAPDVYNYITIMAQVRGQTTTQFINHILRQNMEANREIYERAIEFRNSL
jgi:hypothetical protein